MKRLLTIIAACLSLTASPVFAQGKVEVQWLGQAAFRIVSPGGKVIVIDPWLTANPITPAQYKNLDALGRIDALLVTHGHGDHVGDAPALAKKHNIRLWMPGDLAQTLTTLGVLPPEQLPRFNKSGRVTPTPGINVTAVKAEHSSVYVWNNPATGRPETHPGGEPVGYILEMENGFRIWHMGDTGVFGDMKLIAEYYKPDLVLMPIGGNFTMDPADAAFAARELIRPKAVVPIHYGANPLAKGTAEEFLKAMAGAPTRVFHMKPGDKIDF
jgi:L-ascorbate metabolism protein UlaG (beta-lactamase superfamily)